MRAVDLDLALRTRDALKSGRAREQREALGARQPDVARVLGVSAQSVSAWESGKKVPTAAHALAYGKLLRALAKRAP